jgi:hypothetical protein
MIKTSSKIIITSLATICLLAVSSTMLNAFSQGLEVPEFKSKAVGNIDSSNPASANTPSEEIAMKVQLEEHDSEVLANAGYYVVSDFAFIASNSSKLCPSGTCEYELEDGQMTPGVSAGDQTLTGKFKVDTGESKKVMNMRGSWETVEERETPDGETVQVIEGDIGMGRNQFNPENKYQINGTLTSDSDEYLLEVKGMK